MSETSNFFTSLPAFMSFFYYYYFFVIIILVGVKWHFTVVFFKLLIFYKSKHLFLFYLVLFFASE